MTEEPKIVYVERGPNSFQTCLSVVGGMVLLGALALLFTCSSSAPDSSDLATEDDPQTLQSVSAPGAPEEGKLGARAVRIEDIEAAYAANELAAQQEYGDQWLAVVGTLDAVDLDYADEVVLRFKSDDLIRPSASIPKGFEGGAERLVSGEPFAVVCGKLTEAMGTPRLSECQVLDADGVAATIAALEE